MVILIYSEWSKSRSDRYPFNITIFFLFFFFYVFCFLQIRTLQCKKIFKTILVEERLNIITIYCKRKEKKNENLYSV